MARAEEGADCVVLHLSPSRTLWESAEADVSTNQSVLRCSMPPVSSLEPKQCGPGASWHSLCLGHPSEMAGAVVSTDQGVLVCNLLGLPWWDAGAGVS